MGFGCITWKNQVLLNKVKVSNLLNQMARVCDQSTGSGGKWYYIRHILAKIPNNMARE
jgi:hypothetical protein